MARRVSGGTEVAGAAGALPAAAVESTSCPAQYALKPRRVRPNLAGLNPLYRSAPNKEACMTLFAPPEGTPRPSPRSRESSRASLASLAGSDSGSSWASPRGSLREAASPWELPPLARPEPARGADPAGGPGAAAAVAGAAAGAAGAAASTAEPPLSGTAASFWHTWTTTLALQPALQPFTLAPLAPPAAEGQRCGSSSRRPRYLAAAASAAGASGASGGAPEAAAAPDAAAARRPSYLAAAAPTGARLNRRSSALVSLAARVAAGKEMDELHDPDQHRKTTSDLDQEFADILAPTSRSIAADGLGDSEWVL